MTDSQSRSKTDHPYDTTGTHELRLFPREAYEAYRGTGELIEPGDAWRMRKGSGSIDRQIAKLFPKAMRYSTDDVSIFGNIQHPSVVIKKEAGDIRALAWYVSFLTPANGFLAELIELIDLLEKRRLVALDLGGKTFGHEDIRVMLELLLTSDGAREASAIVGLDRGDIRQLKEHQRVLRARLDTSGS